MFRPLYSGNMLLALFLLCSMVASYSDITRHRIPNLLLLSTALFLLTYYLFRGTLPMGERRRHGNGRCKIFGSSCIAQFKSRNIFPWPYFLDPSELFWGNHLYMCISDSRNVDPACPAYFSWISHLPIPCLIARLFACLVVAMAHVSWSEISSI